MQIFIKKYENKVNSQILFANNNYLYLSKTKYGNYVTQCIITKNEWYSNLLLVKQLKNQLILNAFHKNNVLDFSKDKYRPNVIEACIKASNHTPIDILLKQRICDKLMNNKRDAFNIQFLYTNVLFSERLSNENNLQSLSLSQSPQTNDTFPSLQSSLHKSDTQRSRQQSNITNKNIIFLLLLEEIFKSVIIGSKFSEKEIVNIK